MLRNTWQPLEPAHLLALIAGRDRRHVSSGEELLDLLQESLARYQDELHGVGHRIDELWNVDKTERWPKDESAFSRSAQRHLKRDLADRHLVVNREVEVHVRERDDIQVDAIDPHTGARITVIILSALREKLGRQADDLSTSRGKLIRSVVIDAGWPS